MLAKNNKRNKRINKNWTWSFWTFSKANKLFVVYPGFSAPEELERITQTEKS